MVRKAGKLMEYTDTIKNNLYDPTDELIEAIHTQVYIAKEIINCIPIINKNKIDINEIKKSAQRIKDISSLFQKTKNKAILKNELDLIIDNIQRYNDSKHMKSEYQDVFNHLSKNNTLGKDNVLNILQSVIGNLLMNMYKNVNNQNFGHLADSIVMDIFKLEKKWRSSLTYTSISIQYNGKVLFLKHPIKDNNKTFEYKI